MQTLAQKIRAGIPLREAVTPDPVPQPGHSEPVEEVAEELPEEEIEDAEG